MNEYLQQILAAIVPILCLLITAGGAYLVAIVKKHTAQLKAQLDNETANGYIDLAVETVDQVVMAVAQTFVNAFKAENAFTKERQREAFIMAKDKILKILGNTALVVLENVYGDFDEWLNTRIEQVCLEIKGKAKGTAAPALPAVLLLSGAVEAQADKSSPENEAAERAVSGAQEAPKQEKAEEPAAEEPQSEIE